MVGDDCEKQKQGNNRLVLICTLQRSVENDVTGKNSAYLDAVFSCGTGGYNHDGLYEQFPGIDTGGKCWLGRSFKGAYLEEPTNLNIVGGRNTKDQSCKEKVTFEVISSYSQSAAELTKT